MKKAQQEHNHSLYQQHLNALLRQGKSRTTIALYSRAVRRLMKQTDCPLDEVTLEDLKKHFTLLIESCSWSTVKVERSGLRFFYKHVLNKQWQWVDIVKPPHIRTLPDILTHKEISRILHHTRDVRYRTYILTVYSLGLRRSEALTLKVGDIDKELMRVHIRCGKGRKDRFISIPPITLYALRKYWQSHRNPLWLFPDGRNPDTRYQATRPMRVEGASAAFKAVVKSVGIHKSVTLHNLRHSYGTHLSEEGLSLRAIQMALGHTCPKTTALYVQLTEIVQQNTADYTNRMIERLLSALKEEVPA